MDSETQTAPVSSKMLWAGRIVSTLPVLLLVFSGVMKLIQPEGFADEFKRLEWPVSIAFGLGIALLLNRRFPGRGAVRTMMIAPFLIVPIAAR